MDVKQQADLIIKSNKLKKEKIKLLCNLVREIPYKRIGSLDPKDIVKLGKGSCTPKHVFLSTYLRKLNVPVKFLIIPFYYKNMPIKYPKSQMQVVNKMPISYHVALKAKLNRNWTIIDVTWDSKLKGFPVNDDWNGVSDMKFAVAPEEIIEKEVDPERFKKESLKKYTKKELKARKEFYRLFDTFLEKSRE